MGAINARCYLATSVMLGAASERAFGQLASTFVASRSGDTARSSSLLEDPTSTSFQRFTQSHKRLEPLRDALPDGLDDNLTLDAKADLIRVNRNDAGHPTGQTVDEETAFTHLQVAARYLARMTELAKHSKSAAASELRRSPVVQPCGPTSIDQLPEFIRSTHPGLDVRIGLGQQLAAADEIGPPQARGHFARARAELRMVVTSFDGSSKRPVHLCSYWAIWR